MQIATTGAKNAVLDELAELLALSDHTRTALEKLNIKDILSLTKDIRTVIDGLSE